MIKVMIENKNKAWKKVGNITIRRSCITEQELGTIEDWHNIWDKYHDDFAIICEEADGVTAAVDRIRSVPLFYALKEDVFYLSDSVYKIAESIGKVVRNERAVSEMREAAYVTGKETLLEGIYALQSGEYLVYNDEKKDYQIKEYFSYGRTDTPVWEDEWYIQEMIRLHKEVFGDLIKALNGRQAVLPLSGGYDSRLLLHMLCSMGYKNVFCFTYGQEGNAEALVSEKLAKKYQVPWICIPYTPDFMKGLFQSGDYKKYLLFSCNGISTSHMQDFPAVQELRSKGLIEQDAVFLPGHAYDFLAGTHISAKLLNLKVDVSKSTVIKQITADHYIHNSVKEYGREKKLFSELGNESEFFDSVGMYHFWEWKERQAKYIANSVRVYEYFGYEWKLPFWDRRLIAFWDKVPAALRKDRYIFFKYMDKIGLNMHSSNDRKLVTLRKWMPVQIRKALFRIKDLIKNPLCFYSVLSRKEKWQFVMGKKDFIGKVTEDDLKIFYKKMMEINLKHV